MSDERKEKRAIGLAYDGVNAPQVIAKGFDELAEEIIAVAKEHGVMVHEDPLLSDSLARLNVGEEIPRDLYIIIAEIIAFAYLLDGNAVVLMSTDKNRLTTPLPAGAGDDNNSNNEVLVRVTVTHAVFTRRAIKILVYLMFR